MGLSPVLPHTNCVNLNNELPPPYLSVSKKCSLTKIEASSLSLLEEVATGTGMHICPILYQELHALQAPFLNGNMQGTVTSVVLIRALGINQGLRISRVSINLQQWQDAGIDPILKIQHSLHQTCLPCGALCGKKGVEGHTVLRTGAAGLPANVQQAQTPKYPMGG